MYFFYNDHKEHPLNKDDFVTAICSVTGNADLHAKVAEDFFEQVCMEDFNTKEEVILWKQVLNEVRRSTMFFQDAPDILPFDQTDVKMHLMSHCKHESVAKVIGIETEEFFCYAVVSRLGHVGVYDGRLNLLRSYVLPLSRCPDDLTTVARTTVRRRRNVWINDAAYMPDAQFVTVAASDGSVHFVDTVCLVHVPTFCITGLKTTPTCLEYCPGVSSLLFIGDDKGGIAHMEFLQPKRSLFKRDPTNKVDTYLWKDLDSQQEWVRVHASVIPIHPDGIKRIVYCRTDEATISCCQSHKKSLVIRHIRDEWDPYIFHIQHGVRCFHYEEILKLLVTGCSRTVYVWNPVMTKMYMAKLEGHEKPVVDVRIFKHLNLVISISKDEVLKAWNLDTYACAQTVRFDFPVYDVLGKSVEFSGRQTFYPGPAVKRPPEEQQASLKSVDKSSNMATSVPTAVYAAEENWESALLLVVCSNYVATIKRNLSAGSGRQIADHRRRSSPPPPVEDQSTLPPPVEDQSTLPPPVEDQSSLPPPVEDQSSLPPSVQWTTDDDDDDDGGGGDEPLTDLPPPLVHCRAFELDAHKKKSTAAVGRTKRRADEMVRNGTPYLAMSPCPVYRLRLSRQDVGRSAFRPGLFPLLDRLDEAFCDGIAYDDDDDERRPSEPLVATAAGRPPHDADVTARLMDAIDRLTLDGSDGDDDDDVENVIGRYV